MRSTFALVFAMSCFTAGATNYYISANGNDHNIGTSPSSSWKTLGKLNSFFRSLQPGDNVYLNRGDVFYGSIIINKSGVAHSPITISAYGSGTDPVVTGFTTIRGWTNLGGNIWESNSAVRTFATCNIVLINGMNTPVCRYPNSGWLTYESHSGMTSITSSSLTGKLNWTGGQLCLRSIRWMLEVNPIIAQSGNTLIYSGGSSPGTNGYGFFIQNDSLALDSPNEWWFSKYTKKLRIYSTNSPTNVQVPTIDGLVLCSGFNYITFDHLNFEGANSSIFENRNSKYIHIQNCIFKFAENGILADHTKSANEIMWIEHNTFKNLNNHATYMTSYSQLDTTRYNNIDSIGMIPGGWFETNQNSGDAIILTGRPGTAVLYNTISNIGHTGIYCSQRDGLNASYNYISNFGMTRYDAGGIYSWNQDSTTTTSRIFDHNIIIGSNQVSAGIGKDDPSLFGIYLDGSSKNTHISNNTISGCYTSGIHILNSGTVTITNNTSYDNGNQLEFTHAFGGGMKITGIVVKHNIFFSKNKTQPVFSFRDDDNSLFNKFGIVDSNYYARPIDDNLLIQTAVAYTKTNRTLSGWQAFSGQDLHSKKSPKTIFDKSHLRFEYNATNSPKKISLDANYVDVKGNSYNLSVMLAPYSSVVLIN